MSRQERYSIESCFRLLSGSFLGFFDKCMKNYCLVSMKTIKDADFLPTTNTKFIEIV